MNTITEEVTEILNDLIKINNDRIAGYEKAAEEIKKEDLQLQQLFMQLANDSRAHVAELSNRISAIGGETEGGTTGLGKLYRAWMDVKATFTGKDLESILNSCEYGEDAAQRAYTDALASDGEIDPETRRIISTQKASLKNSHDMIKEQRDVRKS